MVGSAVFVAHDQNGFHALFTVSRKLKGPQLPCRRREERHGAARGLPGAGCAATPDETPSPSDGLEPLPADAFVGLIDPDHTDHTDAEAHSRAVSAKLVSRIGMEEVVPPGMPGSISAMDVHEGYVALAGLTDPRSLRPRPAEQRDTPPRNTASSSPTGRARGPRRGTLADI